MQFRTGFLTPDGDHEGMISRLICASIAVLCWVGPAWAGKVVISSRECARLVTEHVPAPDVAYRPGTDASGRKVAPADLNGGYPQIPIPKEIEFDVSVDLRNFLGGPKADAQAASASVAAADSAAASSTAAEAAAQQAEAASLADPTNTALAAAASSARTAANTAAAAVGAGDKSAAAKQAADAATSAAVADPLNAPLAAAATVAQSAANTAVAASTAMDKSYIEAARIGQFVGRPVVGRVKVRGHKVFFNGQLIGDSARQAIIESCRAQTAGAEVR